MEGQLDDKFLNFSFSKPAGIERGRHYLPVDAVSEVFIEAVMDYKSYYKAKFVNGQHALTDFFCKSYDDFF